MVKMPDKAVNVPSIYRRPTGGTCRCISARLGKAREGKVHTVLVRYKRIYSRLCSVGITGALSV